MHTCYVFVFIVVQYGQKSVCSDVNANYDLNYFIDNETCFNVPALHVKAAQKVWNYLIIRDELQKSDVILGLGSHDRRVAIEAARLWLLGYGKYLMFSGNSGNLTRGKWGKPEAEVFRNIALSMGVPNERILIETKSINTGENLQFSYKLLKDKQLLPERLILVQKPHMGRRTLSTFEQQWPDLDNKILVFVTSTLIPLEQYPNADVGDLQDVISVLLGYLQRIKLYSSSGFQSYQYIPPKIWDAYKFLEQTGLYNSHLLPQ